MSGRHSPGPWHVHDNNWPKLNDGNVWHFVYAGDPENSTDMVAEIGRTANPIPEDIARETANAHLISAAPELLAALKAIIAEEDRLLRTGECETNLAELIAAARPAVTKAEGGVTE